MFLKQISYGYFTDLKQYINQVGAIKFIEDIQTMKDDFQKKE